MMSREKLAFNDVTWRGSVRWRHTTGIDLLSGPIAAPFHLQILINKCKNIICKVSSLRIRTKSIVSYYNY